ncbi:MULTISPECIES: type IV secretory system conjugative DNA transfer family protein [Bacteria]|uniref:type IV secretory system conjugative DNA transfer family protein n=1 Tax=Bacteria TaxID=2 RepID=UPI003C7C13CB
MSAVTRRTGAGAGLTTAALALFVIAFGWVFSWTIAQWMSTGTVAFVNPVEALVGQVPWTGAHTAVMVGAGVIAAAIIAGVIVAVVRGDRAKEDRAAIHMGKGKEIAPLLPSTVAKTHKHLGLDPKAHRGVQLGYTVAGNLPVRASFESTTTVIAGPRRNKSVALVIPNVLDAPGTCVTTSAKPDVLEATIGYRSTLGRVHVFDAQGIAPAYAEYGVWWNALGEIRLLEDAENLATILSAYYVSESRDQFFEKEGSRLLADYMFAAAHARLYLPVVLEWLTTEDNPNPSRILQESHPEVAARIDAAQAVTERTRSGVFTYARGAVSFLASSELRAWVQPGGNRREIVPKDLVASPRDTLYLLSKEGQGSAGPLVSALTKTILDAAEVRAEASPRARLTPPLMAVLDEAGNICRIPDLPARYSHYGSRGIIVMTILQSQEQGEKVWPDGGFGALWAASTVQVFAGGNASATFYRDLSERIGDYEYTEKSTSTGKGGASNQVARRSERIMDVRDLDSLSLGRMVVLASGARPTLVRTRPWFKDKRMKKLVAMTPEQNHRTAGEPSHV